MTTPSRAERDALCDLFVLLGPEAPTLCEGWNGRDLAAHLVVRERRPDAALGLVVRRLAGRMERVMANEAKRPWIDLLRRVRSGPPRFSPMSIGPVEQRVNTTEYFVH